MELFAFHLFRFTYRKYFGHELPDTLIKLPNYTDSLENEETWERYITLA